MSRWESLGGQVAVALLLHPERDLFTQFDDVSRFEHRGNVLVQAHGGLPRARQVRSVIGTQVVQAHVPVVDP